MKIRVSLRYFITDCRVALISQCFNFLTIRDSIRKTARRAIFNWNRFLEYLTESRSFFSQKLRFRYLTGYWKRPFLKKNIFWIYWITTWLIHDAMLISVCLLDSVLLFLIFGFCTKLSFAFFKFSCNQFLYLYSTALNIALLQCCNITAYSRNMAFFFSWYLSGIMYKKTWQRKKVNKINRKLCASLSNLYHAKQILTWRFSILY